MLHPYDIIFIGLGLDVVGAVVLAKGFMLKSAREAFYESQTVFGSNSHLLKSAMNQRAEAQLGTAFLFVGFFMQMWGNLHGGIEINQLGWVNSTPRMLLVLVGAGAFGVLCLIIAKATSDAQFFRVFFRKFSEDSKLPDTPASDPTWLDRMGRLLNTTRKRNESDADFRIRLEAAQARLGMKYRGQLDWE